MIDDNIFAKLEKLSALQIDNDKREQVKEQISNLLNFVENLQLLNLDSDNFEIIEHLELRDDIVANSNVAKDILESSPYSKDGFFIVPKIVE